MKNIDGLNNFVIFFWWNKQEQFSMKDFIQQKRQKKMEGKSGVDIGQNRRSHQIEVRFKAQPLQKRKVKTWTPQQDQLLFQLHDRYPKKWNKIAEMMRNRNQNQCLHRYRRLVQAGDHKKIWSPEQDKTVLEMVLKYGNNWKFIAATLKTKTGKQIRQRYINKLDPTIKRQEWSHAEDFKIIELYTKFGSKWSQISKELKGRPQNRIKNRFYSYILKNYDILIKDEGVTNSSEISPQQSSYMKSPQAFDEKQFQPTFIYVPNLQEKAKHTQSNEFSPENKENKVQESPERIEKYQYEKGFRPNSRKSIDEDWNRERSFHEINQPNQIAYECHTHGNQDLLYFEED